MVDMVKFWGGKNIVQMPKMGGKKVTAHWWLKIIYAAGQQAHGFDKNNSDSNPILFNQHTIPASNNNGEEKATATGNRIYWILSFNSLYML